MQTNLRLSCHCVMAQAVTWRPLITQACVRPQVSACESLGGQCGTGTGFSPSTWIYNCQYHFTITLYSFSAISCSNQKDKRAKSGNLPKRNALPEIREHGIETYFRFSLAFQACKPQNIRAYTSAMLWHKGNIPSLLLYSYLK